MKKRLSKTLLIVTATVFIVTACGKNTVPSNTATQADGNAPSASIENSADNAGIESGTPWLEQGFGLTGK
ncbi:hypothetical protein [Butyrivibrio sp. AE2032]|uniref:hypothetical protein n=1 Tax=Butyrivibrio sp. AE2032 TaxID=1458463 RepID=UPI000551BA89|nr:hypothetical protein [Butyrivibrio sp. AE2032]